MRCAVLLADSAQQKLRFASSAEHPEDYKEHRAIPAYCAEHGLLRNRGVPARADVYARHC